MKRLEGTYYISKIDQTLKWNEIKSLFLFVESF